ncbi:MAG: hypothetical protein ACF8NJ_10445 [Phycisphaerales bacterium JB038]
MRFLIIDPRRRAAILFILLVGLAGGLASADSVCGDLNGDHRCDTSDLGILLADFGCSGGDCPGDIDGDGDTDQADLAWWTIGFHRHDSPAPCEPLGTGPIDAFIVPVDNSDVGLGDDSEHPEFLGGVTHFTFDLIAEIGVDNDWTTAASRLIVVTAGVELFQHDIGNDVEPPGHLLNYFPALAYDTFCAAPPALFDGYYPAFADWVGSDPMSYGATWFDTHWSPDAISTLQRFTLVVDAGSGIAPGVFAGDCAYGYPVLARFSTDLTSTSTGADFLHGEYLIVDLAHPCPGDVDLDGDVDQSDLGTLLAAYNRPSDDPLYDERADLDCDGDVDQSDLGILMAAYGADC